MAELSEKKRDKLSTSKFAFPKERKMPLNDASHVRNALARFNQVEGVSASEKAALVGCPFSGWPLGLPTSTLLTHSSPILDIAREFSVPNAYLPPGQFRTRLEPAIEADLVRMLRDAGVAVLAARE